MRQFILNQMRILLLSEITCQSIAECCQTNQDLQLLRSRLLSNLYEPSIDFHEVRDSVSAYRNRASIHILQNDRHIQSVRSDPDQVTGIVFYEAGSLIMEDHLKLSTNIPCLLQIRKLSEKLQISAAIFRHTPKPLTLIINKNLHGENIQPDESGKSTQIIFAFPEGQYTGQTITRIYDILP